MKNKKRMLVLYESIVQDIVRCSPYGKQATMLEHDGKQYAIELNDVKQVKSEQGGIGGSIAKS